MMSFVDRHDRAAQHSPRLASPIPAPQLLVSTDLLFTWKLAARSLTQLLLHTTAKTDGTQHHTPDLRSTNTYLSRWQYSRITFDLSIKMMTVQFFNTCTIILYRLLSFCFRTVISGRTICFYQSCACRREEGGRKGEGGERGRGWGMRKRLDALQCVVNSRLHQHQGLFWKSLWVDKQPKHKRLSVTNFSS